MVVHGLQLEALYTTSIWVEDSVIDVDLCLGNAIFYSCITVVCHPERVLTQCVLCVVQYSKTRAHRNHIFPKKVHNQCLGSMRLQGDCFPGSDDARVGKGVISA